MPIDFNVLIRQPLMIVISGPSGVGKDAVIRALKKRDLFMHFVVTANTRTPRADEREGVDYFFVSKKRFMEMVAKNELIEHSFVYNDYKGIPRAQVEQAIASGKDVIMRLDVQGAEKIRKLHPEALLIFIVPVNEQEWFERLRNRTCEPPADLELRIQTAQQELQKLSIFDYVVVNPQNHLEEAVDQVISIIEVEHHRTHPRRITP